MVSIKIYVEGAGGRGQPDLTKRCRQAFHKFFEKAGFKGRMPTVIPCGGRQTTYEDFCTALKNASQNELPMLLIDSENAVNQSPWEHLKSNDGWKRPPQAQDNQAHLMVQVMESWFLADRPTLARHFGQGFRESALPNQSKVEELPKQQVFDSLKAATRKSSAGAYDKGKHSFDVLGKIDPAKVRSVSPHAERLLNAVNNPSE